MFDVKSKLSPATETEDSTQMAASIYGVSYEGFKGSGFSAAAGRLSRVGLRASLNVVGTEADATRKCILSILKKASERSETILRYSAVLRFAVPIF